ncbi:MAG TPA: hypothetical protein ENO22_10145 [candidate division Zixibacteria bacterium]|nr:hypothetical protein [candidate division Zixibacteria bacterium]
MIIKKLALLILTALIIPAGTLHARQYELEKVKTWPSRANLMGSPDGYMYITQYKKVEVYSPPSNRILDKRIKGNEKVFTSPGGNYWAASEFVDRSADQYRVIGLSMFTPEGENLYSIDDPGALKFILNDNSPRMVGIEGTEGLPETELYFYDESGNITGTYKLTNYLDGRFCRDGSLFFAYSADSGLYAFSPSGDLYYRLNSGRNFALNQNGRLVLASNGGHLNLYYQTSKTNSAELNTSKIREIIISDDNTRAVVMSDDNAVCYSIPDLKPLWQYNPVSSYHHLSSCDYDSETGRTAIGIAVDSGSDYPFSERYNTGKVVIVDPAGEIMGSVDVSYTSWSKGFPKVQFASEGETLWVISHYDLFRIAL